MPRNAIEVPGAVEHLSVLDEDGAFDRELAPELDDATLLRMHRVMLLSRRFDERLLRLQRQGRIGTFVLNQGQEASAVGAVAALRPDDWLVPSFRELGAAIWRGASLSATLLYYGGFNEGGGVRDGRRDLPLAVPVASQLPHAVGLAYAARYRRSGEVVMTFFGDGATSEGDFHEAMNLAGVLRAPVVFVCQNNGWAISLPRERQTASATLAQKAHAYGMPGVQADGNDVFAVHLAAREAVERARAGDGPTMIECLTYRMSLHTTADDPAKYRDPAEVEEWRARDPIARLQAHLTGRGLLTAEAIASLEAELAGEIDAAWAEAEAAMRELGDPAAMFDHVYATMPASLERQRAAAAPATGTGLQGAGG